MSQVVELFTIGYSGRSASELVDVLGENDVKRLVDVRLTPTSRKKGLSAVTLSERLRQTGIAYEHISGLGNPPAIRELFLTGAVAEGRRRFRKSLSNGRAVYVDRLLEAASAETTAIMCVEAHPEECHRDVVAEIASERAEFELRITHL